VKIKISTWKYDHKKDFLQFSPTHLSSSANHNAGFARVILLCVVKNETSVHVHQQEALLHYTKKALPFSLH